MGTRALLVFDGQDRQSVYKHWDGYPSETLPEILNAAVYAWPLPRFEGSDYAAAFIAANKPRGGGSVRVDRRDACTADDWEDYCYIISADEKSVDPTQLIVEIRDPLTTIYKGRIADYISPEA